MATQTRKFSWDTVSRLRRLQKLQTISTFGLVVLGPVLALVTYLVMGPLDQGSSSKILRIVLLADLIYVIIVAALVLQRVLRMVADRRSQSAGSRLHMRLTGVFTLMALIPTITVAVFATLSINMGLEAWFSDRVGRVVSSSVAAAQAYEEEHRVDLVTDAQALASVINATKRAAVFIDDGDIRQVLSRGQREIQRGLREAFVIDGTGEIRARGERSYLFDFEQPSADQMAKSRERRCGGDPGLGQQRVSRAAAAGGDPRPVSLCQPQCGWRYPEPAGSKPRKPRGFTNNAKANATGCCLNLACCIWGLR